MPQIRKSYLIVPAVLLTCGLAACHNTTQTNPTPQHEAATTIQPPAPAQDTQKQQAVLQYAQMSLLKIVGNRCHWLDTPAIVAIDASLAERQAWLQWQQVPLASAKAKTAELEKQTAHIQCDTPEGRQNQLDIASAVFQLRSSWAIRAYSLLPSASQPAWFQGRSTVEKHKTVLAEVITGLKSIQDTTVDASISMFQDQAKALLAARCNAGQPACPHIIADPAYKSYAEQVLVQAERYADALEGAADKIGRPPTPKQP